MLLAPRKDGLEVPAGVLRVEVRPRPTALLDPVSSDDSDICVTHDVLPQDLDAVVDMDLEGRFAVLKVGIPLFVVVVLEVGCLAEQVHAVQLVGKFGCGIDGPAVLRCIGCGGFDILSDALELIGREVDVKRSENVHPVPGCVYTGARWTPVW